jgi:hypothetical protein
LDPQHLAHTGENASCVGAPEKIGIEIGVLLDRDNPGAAKVAVFEEIGHVAEEPGLSHPTEYGKDHDRNTRPSNLTSHNSHLSQSDCYPCPFP